MRRHRLFSTLLACITGLSLCACGSSGELNSADTVRIAIQPSAAFIPLYIAKEKGWIEEALKPYGTTVVWNTFESGPPMNDSLLAGDSDIGVIGDVPVVTVAAPGNKVSVIATAAKAADSYAILVPAGSDIRSASDLEGKQVATTFGSTGHNMVEKYLKTSGLSIDDINLLNIAAGDAASVLSRNQAAAVSTWEPNVTRLTADGSVRILCSGSGCGLAGTNGIVARDRFAKNNPEIVSIILGQYKRAADELENMDEATLTAVAAALNITRDQLDVIIPKFRYTVEIDDEDIAALNDTIDFLNRNRIMRKSYDIKDRIDTSYYKGY